MLRCESVFLATRISDMVLILVLAGKSPAAKNEILRSLRSLRMTKYVTIAEILTLNFEL